MFKLLILQCIYNLADERLQFQVTDRLTFMRFLGLEFGACVLDARTVWTFREELKEHDLVDALFDRFNNSLARHIPKHVRLSRIQRQFEQAMCLDSPLLGRQNCMQFQPIDVRSRELHIT